MATPTLQSPSSLYTRKNMAEKSPLLSTSNILTPHVGFLTFSLKSKLYLFVIKRSKIVVNESANLKAATGPSSGKEKFSSEIRLGLTGFFFSSFLGIIFRFDKGFFEMGNIPFISGVMLTFGMRSTMQFFMKLNK